MPLSTSPGASPRVTISDLEVIRVDCTPAGRVIVKLSADHGQIGLAEATTARPLPIVACIEAITE